MNRNPLISCRENWPFSEIVMKAVPGDKIFKSRFRGHLAASQFCKLYMLSEVSKYGQCCQISSNPQLKVTGYL
ncbi:hypothetical protein Plhal304r1_c013g0050381 [Plasmopara halstedii]